MNENPNVVKLVPMGESSERSLLEEIVVVIESESKTLEFGISWVNLDFTYVDKVDGKTYRVSGKCLRTEVPAEGGGVE